MSSKAVCGKVFLKKLPKSNTEFGSLEAFIKIHNLKMPLWQCEMLALKITHSDEPVIIGDIPQTIDTNKTLELLDILADFQAYQIKIRNQRNKIDSKVQVLCQTIPDTELETLQQINILYEKLRNYQGPEVVITEFTFLGSVSGMNALWKPKAWLKLSSEDRQLIIARSKELMGLINNLDVCSNLGKIKRDPGSQHGSEMHFQFFLDAYLPRLRGEDSLLDQFD